MVICTNHGEYFYNILTRKLVAEVLKLFILCWTRDTVPVQAIYLPKSTIFLLLKCVMVICPYSAHITMANFLPII